MLADSVRILSSSCGMSRIIGNDITQAPNLLNNFFRKLYVALTIDVKFRVKITSETPAKPNCKMELMPPIML